MKPNASCQPGEKSAPCRTCAGKKTINVQAHNKGGVTETKAVTCPACRGSGNAGYVTK